MANSGFGASEALDAADFAQIESTIAQTERGRRFLAEHARRNRGADTQTLLLAIGRLQSAMTAEREASGFTRFRGDLADMAAAIARTRNEIGAMGTAHSEQSRLTMASEALDAIIRATERATSDILGAAEEVQEVAWSLRESGAEANACFTIDPRATEIYTACSFQDLTAQRTARVIHTLRYLEDRIAAMIAIWGEEIAPVPAFPQDLGVGPAAPEQAGALGQSDIDRVIAMQAAIIEPIARPALMEDDELVFVPVQPEPLERDTKPAQPEPVAKPAPSAETDDLAAAFGDLDRLSIEEKIALFS